MQYKHNTATLMAAEITSLPLMENQVHQDQTSYEKTLVEKVQAGQSENFILLYDRYVEKIYRFLVYRVNHRETAEDLTSQTFLKAYDNISSFNPDKGTFQSWVYKIAYNLLVDHYRKSKPTLDIAYAENVTSGDDTQKSTEDYFAQQQVQALLKTLPEATQELIILRVWQDLSYSEIAKILNKTEASLKMQFSRAIASLRELESQS